MLERRDEGPLQPAQEYGRFDPREVRRKAVAAVPDRKAKGNRGKHRAVEVGEDAGLSARDRAEADGDREDRLSSLGQHPDGDDHPPVGEGFPDVRRG